MPRELFDEAGNKVEVPDESELAALKAAQADVDKLKQEIKDLSDKSPEGVKALRDALARKEAKIATLESKVSEKPPQAISAEEIQKMTAAAAQKAIVDAELARTMSAMSDEDKKAFRAKFDKLTAGEEVNLETLTVFAEEAARAAGISAPAKAMPMRTGKSARTEDAPKGFAETDAGKEFAKRMGLQIEKPAKK